MQSGNNWCTKGASDSWKCRKIQLEVLWNKLWGWGDRFRPEQKTSRGPSAKFSSGSKLGVSINGVVYSHPFIAAVVVAFCCTRWALRANCLMLFSLSQLTNQRKDSGQTPVPKWSAFLLQFIRIRFLGWSASSICWVLTALGVSAEFQERNFYGQRNIHPSRLWRFCPTYEPNLSQRHVDSQFKLFICGLQRC